MRHRFGYCAGVLAAVLALGAGLLHIERMQAQEVEGPGLDETGTTGIGGGSLGNIGNGVGSGLGAGLGSALNTTLNGDLHFLGPNGNSGSASSAEESLTAEQVANQLEESRQSDLEQLPIIDKLDSFTQQ